MSKNLKTIQTLSKIAKVFSKVLFILCIVGGVGSLVGLVALAAVQGVQFNGESIKELIFAESGESVETLCFYCLTGAIACAAEAVLCRFAEKYFTNELNAGTPFTFAGAKEMLRLGILTIVVPVAAAIVQGIAYGVYSLIFPNVQNPVIEDAVSIGIGIMFIVASVVFKYGAELSQEKNGDETQER